MNDKESVNFNIELLESKLYKQCDQLREYIFNSENYDYTLIKNLAANIKSITDNIILECENLNNIDS